MKKTKMTFKLTGQIPSGKNAITVTRTGHRFPSKRFQNWKQDATKQLNEQLPSIIKTMDTSISVSITYTPADRRRRDVPGMIDALWHLIEDYGIVSDDRWLGCYDNEVIFKTKQPDKENAGVVVRLYEVNCGAAKRNT